MVDLLQPYHKNRLLQSGIKEDVFIERGYRSIRVRAELKRLGFADYQCSVPTLLVPIHGVAGGVVLYHHRPDQPRMDAKGKIVKYEFPKGQHMAVDVHPRIRSLVRDPSVPLFITEGVKKADAAVSIGLCCIGVIGTWNWRGTNEFGGKTALPDWESVAFKGQHDEPRLVYICYDSDVMTKPQVHLALVRFAEFLKSRGARVAYIYLPAGADGSKVGLDDYLAAGHGADDLLHLVSMDLRKPAFDEQPDAVSGEETDEDGGSVSQKLVALMDGVAVFHDEREEGYARLPVADHIETRPISSVACERWLGRAYWKEYGKPATASSMADALRVIEGLACYDGAEHELGVRCTRGEVGADGDIGAAPIYIDMANKRWCAIKVTADGWEIIDEPPPLFRRHASQTAMVDPDPTAAPADIMLLRPLINVASDSGGRLYIAWVVAALIPEIPHPILVVYGEQGSAKSTMMRITSRIIDPSKTELKSAPIDLAQWVQTADHAWMITLDNISDLPDWLSDALCRAVTGDAIEKRKLYTNNEDILRQFRRVLAVTGIEVVAQQPDLLDRSIPLGLEPIPPDKRRLEAEVLADFEKVRKRVTGGLLALLSAVLRELPHVRLGQMPRMADFARVGVAVERVLGWPPGSFLAAYMETIGEQNAEALSSTPITDPLLTVIGEKWDGTSQELLTALNGAVDEKMTRSPGWPRTARHLSGKLSRLAPNLRRIGIGFTRDRTGRRRELHFLKSGADQTVTTVTTVTDAHQSTDFRTIAGIAPSEEAAVSDRLSDDDDGSDGNPTLIYDGDDPDDDGFDPILAAIRR